MSRRRRSSLKHSRLLSNLTSIGGGGFGRGSYSTDDLRVGGSAHKHDYPGTDIAYRGEQQGGNSGTSLAVLVVSRIGLGLDGVVVVVGAVLLDLRPTSTRAPGQLLLEPPPVTARPPTSRSDDSLPDAERPHARLPPLGCLARPLPVLRELQSVVERPPVPVLSSELALREAASARHVTPSNSPPTGAGSTRASTRGRFSPNATGAPNRGSAGIIPQRILHPNHGLILGGGCT